MERCEMTMFGPLPQFSHLKLESSYYTNKTIFILGNFQRNSMSKRNFSQLLVPSDKFDPCHMSSLSLCIQLPAGGGKEVCTVPGR